MSTSIDVARARRETPGCERVIHVNNAGAALMPTPVIDALTLPRIHARGSDLRQLLTARVKGATPMGRRYVTVSACTLL